MSEDMWWKGYKPKYGGPILPKNWTFFTGFLWFVFSLVYASFIIPFYSNQLEKIVNIIAFLNFIPSILVRNMTINYNNSTKKLANPIEKILIPRKYGPKNREKIFFIAPLGIFLYYFLTGKLQIWLVVASLLFNVIMFVFSDYSELKKIIKKIKSGDKIDLLVEDDSDWDNFYEWITKAVNEINSEIEKYSFTLSLKNDGIEWIAGLNFDQNENKIRISTSTAVPSPIEQMYNFTFQNENYIIKHSGTYLELGLSYSEISKESINNALKVLISSKSYLEDMPSPFMLDEPGILSFSERTSVYSFPLHPMDIICLGMIIFGATTSLRLIFHLNYFV